MVIRHLPKATHTRLDQVLQHKGPCRLVTGNKSSVDRVNLWSNRYTQCHCTSFRFPLQRPGQILKASMKTPLNLTWTVFKGAKTPVPTASALVCVSHSLSRQSFSARVCSRASLGPVKQVGFDVSSSDVSLTSDNSANNVKNPHRHTA